MNHQKLYNPHATELIHGKIFQFSDELLNKVDDFNFPYDFPLMSLDTATYDAIRHIVYEV